MKLTKKLEAEIKKFMKTYWDTYLKGDLKTWATFLPADYKNIGGTEEEIWNSKKEILDYTKRVINQMVGQAEIRNTKTQIFSYDPYIMVHEFTEMFVKVDKKWTFYGKFRLSSIIQKMAGGWKVLHQHGSYPDSKAAEGEAFSVDQLKSENIKLLKAVKSRTLELEEKNRELEIETSLEKVRAQALGMKKPEDLPNVCEVLFNELQALGFAELRNAMVNIHNDEKRTFVNYDFSDEIGKSITPLFYDIHPVIKKQIKKIRSADDAFSETVFKGKDLESWKAFRKSRGEKEDKRIKNSTALYYYFYSIGTGSIGISTFNAIPKEKKEVLKQFSNVFEFAYRRYMDVAQAEAQAREAQIELGLERVRARSLAMHDTSELQAVIHTVHQELLKLNIGIHGGSFIAINVDIDKELHCWGAGGTADTSEEVKIPYYNKPFYTNLLKRIKKGAGFFTEAYTQQEKKKFFTHLFKHKPWSKLSAKEKKEVLSSSGGYTRSCAVLKHTSIFIINHFGKIFSEEENNILIRFGKVFEQSYTRFLDLQKAEAQTREAQIELGLERVRARAMAMQTSNELSDLVDTVFKELTNLDMALNWCIINIIDAPTLTNMVWAANPDINKAPESYLMKFEDYPFHDAMMKGYKGKKVKFVYTAEGKEKKEYDNYLFSETEFRKVPKEAQAASRAMKRYVCSFSFSNFCGLQTVGEEPLSEDNLDILARFGKVFDLTYTRFNDLLKAEAQAREAKIEAALENVRSRSMAMQKSEELGEVILLLLKKLPDLGIVMENRATAIFTFESGNKDYFQWAASPEYKTLISFLTPYIDHPVQNDIWNARQNGTDFYVKSYTVEEKNSLFKYFFELPALKNIPKEDKKKALGFKYYEVAIAFEKNSAVVLVTHSGIPLTEGEREILKRFSKVFEQSFTRFLDLQKAEAQAREAKIEAALERVRSRSMAMHKTDELFEAAELVYKELTVLDITSFNVSYAFVHEDKKKDEYYGVNPMDGKIFPFPVIFPQSETPVMSSIMLSWKKSEPFNLIELDEEGVKKHQTYIGEHILAQLINNKINTPFSVEEFVAESPETAAVYSFNYTNGYLFIIREKKLTTDEEQIVLRFTKVFNQTYTRFLDLQKAEAQAREALIEASLERVRSRSLAMHKSDELNEVVAVLFEKIKELKIPATAVGIAVNIEGSKDLNAFVCGENEAGLVITNYRFPYFNNKISNDICNVLEKQLNFYVGHYSKEEKNSFYEYVLEHTAEFRHLPEDIKSMIFESPSYTISMVGTKHSVFNINDFEGKVLSENDIDIIKRFAKVFDQAYTRFLDLKKAEAQTREAEINLAVERVRARALAMYKSDEILQLVFKLKQEMMDLDIPNVAAATIHLKKNDGNYTMWDITSMELNDGKLHQPMVLNYRLDKVDPKLFIKRMWENTAPYFLVVQDKEDFKRTIQFLRDHDRTKEADESEAFLKTAQIMNGYHPTIPLNNGRMCIDLLEPPSAEIETILTKMGATFDLAYKRFEDLQKAEAQSKEAQIEAALERVRSRSMGMQKSDELADLSFELVKQVQALRVPTWFCAFNIYDDDQKGSLEWGSNAEGTYKSYRTPREGIFLRYYEAGQKGETLLINEIGEKECPGHYEYLCSLPGVGEQLLKMKDAGIAFPTSQIDHVAYFKYGYIIFITYDAVPDAHDVFKRFAKVFEQTYTRFLDLQKAEAQTREAQIENALEKVRSRSLAMHKSDELKEVVIVVLKKLQELNIAMESRVAVIVVFKENSRDFNQWVASPDFSTMYISTPYFDHKILSDFWKAKESGIAFYSNDYTVEEKDSYFKHFFDHSLYENIEELDVQKKWIFEREFYTYSPAFEKKSSIGIADFSGIPLVEKEIDIIKRFAKVFEQAYTRFLDLQKAEAQAREAEIELALERVRARTMAMQRSEELLDVATVLFQQVKALGVPQWNCGFNIWNKGDTEFIYYPGSPDGIISPSPCKISLTEHPIFKQFDESRNRGDELLIYEKEGEIQEDHYRYMLSLPEVGDLLQSMLDAGFELPTFQIDHVANFAYGNLIFITYQHFPEMHDVFKRFAKVFEQTYTRFLDLQKSEAQAREAQIETALERVRSRTMGMQKSEELKEVIQVVYEQFVFLNINIEHAGIILDYKEKDDMFIWLADRHEVPSQVTIPYFDSSHWNSFNEAKENGIDFFATHLDFEEKNKFYRDLFEFIPGLPEETVEFYFSCPGLAGSTVLLENVSLYIENFDGIPYTDEENKTLMRFGKVFQQTYTRFLDLQKAENQTREAEINLAVERVRAKALAMHQSEEIMEVVAKLKDEVMALNIPDVVAATIFLSEGEDKVRMWVLSSIEKMDEGYQVPLDITFKLKEKDPHLYVKRVWENPENYFVEIQDEKGFERILVWLREHEKNQVADEVEAYLKSSQINCLYHAAKKLNNGKLVIDLLDPPSAEIETILTKMGAAFDLAYKRFEDLQKAEAQVREAQIEAALEKVRSRSLAMHQSEELSDVVNVLFEMMNKLNIRSDGININIAREGTKTFESWLAAPDGHYPVCFHVPYFDHPVIDDIFSSIANKKELLNKVYSFEEKESFFNYLYTHTDFGTLPENRKKIVLSAKSWEVSIAFAKNMALSLHSYSGIIFTDEENTILKRFVKVFEQSHTRFLDLQKAEAQAREAKIENALEKVRSRTMAMQKSEELPEAANVLFMEVQALGIPAWSCGYNILAADKKSSNCIMSSEGEIQVPFVLPLTEHSSLLPWYEAIKNDLDFFVYEQGGDDLVEHYNYMATIPGLEQVFQQFKDAGISLPTHQINHLVRFTNGFLLFITYESVTNAHDIFKRFGNVFEQTYTRFLDLKNAEKLARQAQIDLENLIAAKKKTDDTLTELKSTQTQLIQSEKMASLGELTAGIAHEIQNPLNFVNNFSEVSNELLDEMIEAADKGDYEEVKEILNDVKQNLEKINHHGKRADAIVKGMLQHSRSSSGTKEPTDINALADEYLRLAYHGLRAKDKSFNATMKTEFDEGLEKVNVIPQDIGRVILNLITNAFYVVNEKMKQQPGGYEPTVTVSTSRSLSSGEGRGEVNISVTDNGNGIPQKVLDKIFQPFFTTKPTGQGTGLGLSLSYDIIKAHGGEIKVQTKENEGTEFIIQLPV